MTTLPSKMRAVVHTGDGLNVAVEEVDVPQPKDQQVLVRVRTVGLNPTDWMHSLYVSQKGAVMGCDFVGEVAVLGAGLPPSSWRVGERVSGFIRGGMGKEGAFAEYVAIEYDNLWLVPDNMTDEAAASVPIPAFTAVQSLYLRLALPEFGSEEQDDEDKPWILIWAASTAVGQYAVQLARLSGCRVIATASRQQWDHLQSLGANELVDYKDQDVVEQIKRTTGGTLRYAIDCVTKEDSLPACQLAMSPEGGRVVALLAGTGFELPIENVQIIATAAYTYLAGDDRGFAFGDFKLETSAEEHRHYVKWLAKMSKLFANGQIKAMPTKNFGGLDKISEGFRFMHEGKNRGYKMVYHV